MERNKEITGNKRALSRRRFLQGALAAPLILSATARGQNAPSNRLTLGLVGMGKMMDGHLGSLFGNRDVQIVAMCDVESVRLDLQKKRTEEKYAQSLGQGSFKGIDTYKDFREIAARKDIDAVMIATPDHWHTLVSLAMLESGKDVYCEKPMTLTINEGKALVGAVRRYARVFQTGSQQRSSEEFRTACELVRNGRIGKVEKVYVSVGGPAVECHLPGQPVPEGLDWDMWLGPAPWRPYNSDIAPHLQLDAPMKNLDEITERYGPFPNFRAYRDFSGGGMTDWGAHHFDIAQWGLGMDSSGPVEIIPPNGKDVEYLTYKYANGVVMEHRGYDKEPKSGVTFFGTEGIVMVNRGFIRTDPGTILERPITADDTRLYNSPGHHRDWLDCIKRRSRPICDVEVGHRSASVCHLGNIAYTLKRPLRWNPETEEFVDDAQANRLMQRPMRSPWKLS